MTKKNFNPRYQRLYSHLPWVLNCRKNYFCPKDLKLHKKTHFLMFLPWMKTIHSFQIRICMIWASLSAIIWDIILKLKIFKAISLNLSMKSTSFVLGIITMVLELKLGKIHPNVKIWRISLHTSNLIKSQKNWKRVAPNPSNLDALSLLKPTLSKNA